MKKNYLIGVIFLFLTIPPIMNFILPIKTGLNILGGGESTTIWLSFWGAYLAALGSFVLGFVSHCNNIEAVKQNEKILHNNGWEHLVNRYDHIEKFVINEEYIHHPANIDELISYSKKGDDSAFHLQLSNWRKDVNISSLRIIRYMNNDVQDPNDIEMKEYGLALKNINDKALEIIKVFSEKLSQEETEKKLANMRTDMSIQFSNLMSKGPALLKCEKRRLRDEAKKNDIPCGII